MEAKIPPPPSDWRVARRPSGRQAKTGTDLASVICRMSVNRDLFSRFFLFVLFVADGCCRIGLAQIT